MARTDSLNNFLTDIANSIRNKKGTTDTIPASNFDTEIESIETDPNLQNKSITITENGTQTIIPDTDYDGLSNVEVITNVTGSSSEQLNVFLQSEEPSKKDGIWIKKENATINKISIDDFNISEEWNYDIGTIPIASSYNRVAKYENYLYIFGGRNSSSNCINNCYKYNLETNQYSSIANLPAPLMAFAIGIVGSNIYIFGGQNGATYYTNSYKYDIITDSYSEIRPLPSLISQAGYVTIGTDIYIFGGQRAEGSVLNSCYKYDTLTDTYTQLANMPIANRTITPVVVGTDIYIFGGLGSGGYTNSCYKYDTLTDAYTNLTSLPARLGHSSCGYINGKIYIFGGYGVSGGVATVYSYDINTNKFETENSMSRKIYNAGCICIDNKMYLVLGQTSGGYLNTISSYGINKSKSFYEDTIIISTSTNSYKANLLDNVSVEFNKVYLYDFEKDRYDINLISYYGDGTKWNII